MSIAACSVRFTWCFVVLAQASALLSTGCVDEIPADPAGGDPIHLLVVSHSLASDPDIAAAIDELVDARSDAGDEVEIRVLAEGIGVGSSAGARELRAWIADVYSAQGVLSLTLVGDVPAFFYEGSDSTAPLRISTDWPYRAPFAEFTDTDSDGLIDSIGGDLRALVPVGRVYANAGFVPGADRANVQLGGFLRRMASAVRGEMPSVQMAGLNFIDSRFGWLGPSPLIPPTHMQILSGEPGVNTAGDLLDAGWRGVGCHPSLRSWLRGDPALLLA